MSNDENQLSYLIAEKGPMLLVTLIGPLSRHSMEALTKCQEELAAKPAKVIVLYMRDVSPKVDQIVFPALAKLQKQARDSGAVLRLCSMHPELKRTLLEYGIVRPGEAANNMNDVIEALTAGSSKPAAAKKP